MKKSFPGFPPQALAFFRQLEKNNRRDWFTPRKQAFEERVRGPMVALVELWNDDLRSFAADHVTPPNKALYRIYRDTRFAKDKTPYKTHVGALFFRPGLPKHAGAAFYVGVSHKGVDVGGGMYVPGPDELAAVRRAVAEDGEAFRKIIAPRSLREKLGDLQGERLARVPKPYPPGHPAADLLRLKQFYFFTTLPPETALGPGLRREVASRFKAVAPFVHYLNAIALAAMKDETPDAAPARPEPMF